MFQNHNAVPCQWGDPVSATSCAGVEEAKEAAAPRGEPTAPEPTLPATGDPCGGCMARSGCTFYPLPAEVHEKYQQILEQRFYPAGSMVVRQGGSAHGVFNIRAGAVCQSHLSPDGKRVVVGVLPASGLFGVREVTAGTTYSFNVRTLTDSLIEYVPRSRFVAFLFDYPEVAVSLLIRICGEYEELEQRFRGSVSAGATCDRLVDHLRDLAEACGKARQDEVELPKQIRVQDLADALGCSRQWTSKLLGELEQQGLIYRRRGRLWLRPALLGRA